MEKEAVRGIDWEGNDSPSKQTKNDTMGQTGDVAVQKNERLTVASMDYFMEIIIIIVTLCWVPTVCQALPGKLYNGVLPF